MLHRCEEPSLSVECRLPLGLCLATRTASLEGGVDSALLEFPLHWIKDHELSRETVLDRSGDSWELTDYLEQGL